MTKWIEMAAVLAIDDEQIAEHGGRGGVRDQGLLESALARPRLLEAYGDPPPDIAALTAAYAFGIARDHAFVDGNKRTAAVIAETFLSLNGNALLADDLALLDVILRLADGSLSESELVDWLRGNIKRQRRSS